MYEVTMPKLSDSMEEGKIIQWKVKEGDEVHEGDVLAEVESDKAVMELECFRDGVVAGIVHGDDEEVPVGEVIARIREKGDAPAPASLTAEAEKEPAAAGPAPAAENGGIGHELWQTAPQHGQGCTGHPATQRDGGRIRVPGRMRGQDHVLHRAQRMRWLDGFRCKDVQASAGDAALAQGGHQV